MKKIILLALMAIAASVCEAQFRVFDADHVKSYIVDEGDSLKFTSLSESLTSKERMAVDLGLPSCTKWANMNIGANCATDYGSYFMWGYTEDCSEKYCSYDSCKTNDKEIPEWKGDEQYDAATKNWGTEWETPTYDQINELESYCGFTLTVLKNSNGEDVNGVTVTGPNGNCIFLPAAGCRHDADFSFQGAGGSYWSSSPYDDSTWGACSLLFGSGDYYNDRYDALPIRPVSAQ